MRPVAYALPGQRCRQAKVPNPLFKTDNGPQGNPPTEKLAVLMGVTNPTPKALHRPMLHLTLTSVTSLFPGAGAVGFQLYGVPKPNAQANKHRPNFRYNNLIKH